MMMSAMTARTSSTGVPYRAVFGLDSREVVWIVGQLHLLFGAFVLCVPLFGAAGLTAFSLGWSDQHWPSDLVIGAALGYLAGSFVMYREEERDGGGGEVCA